MVICFLITRKRKEKHFSERLIAKKTDHERPSENRQYPQKPPVNFSLIWAKIWIFTIICGDMTYAFLKLIDSYLVIFLCSSVRASRVHLVFRGQFEYPLKVYWTITIYLLITQAVLIYVWMRYLIYNSLINQCIHWTKQCFLYAFISWIPIYS